VLVPAVFLDEAVLRVDRGLVLDPVVPLIQDVSTFLDPAPRPSSPRRVARPARRQNSSRSGEFSPSIDIDNYPNASFAAGLRAQPSVGLLDRLGRAARRPDHVTPTTIPAVSGGQVGRAGFRAAGGPFPRSLQGRVAAEYAAWNRSSLVPLPDPACHGVATR
jgi:hypothetical protein